MSLYQEITKALNFLINRPSLTALDVYPVGSIYMSVNSTSPATLFGGTWVALNEGRVLIGAGSSYPAGSTGGEANHTLTTDEMPSHSHSGSTDSKGSHYHFIANSNASSSIASSKSPGTPSATGDKLTSSNVLIRDSWTSQWDESYTLQGSSSSPSVGKTDYDGSHSHTVSINSAGSGSAHNNMQPYLSVYMWKRTV